MTKKIIIGLVAVLAVLLVVCLYQQSRPAVPAVSTMNTPVDPQTGHYKITGDDAGRTITFKKGDEFEIYLGGLGGGAKWGNPQYDTSLLHLDTHYNTPPVCDAPGCMIGDMWAFTAIAPGATDITIQDDQNLGDGQVSFKATIAVK